MAEFAVALPAVVLVLAFGLGALGTGVRHVQLQDAAADAARLAARGESPERVSAAVSAAVPGASATRTVREDLVCVTATAPAPLAILGEVRATGCALDGGR
ncbi:TadE family type IV pilus minor pilin [Microbacterium aureliae]